MSKNAEKLQDAIGLISDEYILEAHGQTDCLGDEGQADSAADSHAVPEPEFKATATGGTPQPRKRFASAKPLAIAACLVVALGVGALTFANMTSPKPVADEKEAASIMAVESVDASGEVGAVTEYTAESVDFATTDSVDLMPGTPIDDPGVVSDGEAYLLTAAEWNDNANWPFFTNLVNAGTIGFPVFGVDPTHRVKVTVTGADGSAVRGQQVVLLDEAGNELWRAVSGKDGAAYLFYRDGQVPASVSADGVQQSLVVPVDGGQQGDPVMQALDDVTLTVGSGSAATAGLQVMFIVDTTGSMSDEIAYLQKDFSAIAGEVGNDGVSYSVNFYRDEGDEYVTKCNGFTSDIAAVQEALNNEYASGGGDEPEAVADILAQTITDNAEWRDDCNKVAFLVFDAPPHEGTDAVLDAAIRSAAQRGIRVVPVVASNAERTTELFGRALAICTNGTYVFLTDDSGVGDSHLEPIVGDYTVESLHDVIVRIIQESR